MPIFGQSDEELTKQRKELNDKAEKLEEDQSKLKSLLRRYELDRKELDDDIADFNNRSQHLDRKLDELRMHQGAEEERRQKFESERQAHKQQMDKLETAYRELVESRTRELDEASERWRLAQSDQEKWAEQLQEQQRNVDSGLDRRVAALETAWHERMKELKKKEEELEKDKSDLAKRIEAVTSQSIEAEHGFPQRRAEVEQQLYSLKQKAIQDLDASLAERRAHFAQQEEDQQKRIEACKAKEMELDARKKTIDLAKQNLDATIQELARGLSEERVAEADIGRLRAESRSQRLQNALAEREERVRRLEETEFRINGRSAGEILDEMDRQRVEMSRLAVSVR